MYVSNPVMLQEGVFTYEASAGVLLQTSPTTPVTGGVIEGNFRGDGGILDVIRKDVPGGQFTFVSVQVGQHMFPGAMGTITGFLDGSIVATDSFISPTAQDTLTTINASNLQNKHIDELQILLEAATGYVYADDLSLTPQAIAMPEPSSLVLVGIISIAALAGLARSGRIGLSN